MSTCKKIYIYITVMTKYFKKNYTFFIRHIKYLFTLEKTINKI